jgi:hypothetical protein
VRRFLLILLLIAGGAAALVHGLDIRRQLKAQLESGFSGSVRTLFVSISPQSQAQVDWYRTLSLWLIAGGSGALLLGLIAGYERERAAAKGAKDEKGKRKKQKERR